MEKERTPSASSGQVKSVAIWIRVSTDQQALGDSPQHHEKRARYYAESKGWKVAEVYHLEAVSGKSVMSHPECQRMLKDIKKEHISGLIFSKLARLARNTKELLDFADLFRDSNADLISLQESIDTSTPAGRLFYTMIAAMAQWEREEIASRVAASIPIRAKLGKPIGGKAPFGYQWVDKKLVPDTKYAPIYKLIFELFLEHNRVMTVARILNQKGYRHRTGKLFSATAIRRLLSDSTAKGVHIANQHKRGTKNGGWISKPESEWVYLQVEPIVSEEAWDQVAQLLDDRRKQHKVPSKKPVWLLSGLLHCTCGHKMYVRYRYPKYVCWRCTNKINVQQIDDLYHAQLKGFLYSKERIAHFLESADQTIREKTELVQSISSEREKVVKNMEKIKRLYLEDQISPQGFGQEYKPLETRLLQIDEQIPTLEGEIDYLRIKLRSSDQVLAEARDLYSRWPQMSFEDKRRIVELITKKIVVGNGEVTIHLYYLPSASHLDSSESSGSENVTKGAQTPASSTTAPTWSGRGSTPS